MLRLEGFDGIGERLAGSAESLILHFGHAPCLTRNVRGTSGNLVPCSDQGTFESAFFEG